MEDEDEMGVEGFGVEIDGSMNPPIELFELVARVMSVIQRGSGEERRGESIRGGLTP